jgi:hypothetical protein
VLRPFIFLLFFPAFLAQFAFSQEAVQAGPHVVFQENERQRFGFDDLRFPEWSAGYDIWSNTGISDYRIPIKSVGYKQNDLVNARLVNARALDPDSLQFRISGTEQPIGFTVKNHQLVTLSLPAMLKDYTVSAYYNSVELGQLQVVVYRERVEKVIVVPLVDIRLNRDSLEASLNNIYRQANIRLQVEVQQRFDNADLKADTLLSNPSPAFDRYTEQMRSLRDLYFDTHPNADRNAFYLFVVPGFVNANINGYMVRSKAVGFVRANSEPRFSQNIARQLGRGLGVLTDSWLDGGPQLGTTDNLMDRSAGSRLRFVQWEDLRHGTITYSIYDNYEDVRTNNGIVAYYFWQEDKNGDIVTDKDNLLLSIKRPFKKNYRSYHLNIDNMLFKTIFKINGRPICTWHLVLAAAICTGIFLLGRKVNRRFITRMFPRPRWYRFASRIFQLVLASYLVYLSYLLVNLGYGWYEVRSGPIAELYRKSDFQAVRIISRNMNYRHPSEAELCSELLIRHDKGWNMRTQKQVLYFSVKEDKKGNWNKLRFQADRDSLILTTRHFSAKAESHYLVFNYTAKDGSFKRQQVFNHLGIDITEKLKIQDPANRILLFVNGYRPTSLGRTFEENFRDIQNKGLEFPDSKNLVYNFDRYDYWRPWQAIDEQFRKRINPGETFYADGHFSVSTSNHRSLINFSTLSTIYPKRCLNKEKHHCYSTTSVQSGFFGSRKVKTVSLHNTHPNKRGFEKRRRSGRIAGRNIYQMLNELPNQSKNDTLYIVAHSMGYAYALGIIDELRGRMQFGTLYIIAPENAASGKIDPSEWNEVWQYGSNFNTGRYDAPCLLDGVAPQTKVPGLKSHHRIYIPRQLYTRKGFFDSHFIGYYSWILDIPAGKKGYIQQR